MDKKVRTIPAGEFKAKCLALLDEVGERDEEIIVTKRGRPVARIVPVEAPRTIRRPNLAHLIEYVGDIESPLDVKWKAME